MDREVEVSVICTAYNHEQYLRTCLDGLVSQKTNFPFEIIVHDDASTDGTAAIIREYEEKYPKTSIPNIIRSSSRCACRSQRADSLRSARETIIGRIRRSCKSSMIS